MTAEELKAYADTVGATVTEEWSKGAIPSLIITVKTHDGHERTLPTYTPNDAKVARSMQQRWLEWKNTINPYQKKARSGVNDAPRVQCKKSQFHGHHPNNERCPLC